MQRCRCRASQQQEVLTSKDPAQKRIWRQHPKGKADNETIQLSTRLLRPNDQGKIDSALALSAMEEQRTKDRCPRGQLRLFTSCAGRPSDGKIQIFNQYPHFGAYVGRQEAPTFHLNDHSPSDYFHHAVEFSTCATNFVLGGSILHTTTFFLAKA